MTEIILDESLIVPQIVLDPETGKETTIGFDVKTLLDSRNDRDLNGVLAQDFLAGKEWGKIPLPPYKVRRWVTKHNRLIKRVATLRRDKSVRMRYTYAEETEWKSRLTEEEQHWLSALLEVDLVLYQGECVRRLMAAISEVAQLVEGRPLKKKKRKKRKGKNGRL